MAVRFSLAGNAGERSFKDQVERAALMEELGYHGIFFSESLMSGLDPFQVLAIAAMRTKRIKLGTAIMTMTFREAVVLANQAATLNEISDGRAVLGLGTGDGTTYTMARTAVPLEKFEEGTRIIRDLVNGRTIYIPKGKEREAGEIPLRAGKFPVPIWIAAAGPRALRAAGRVADGVILGCGFDLGVLKWAREQITLALVMLDEILRKSNMSAPESPAWMRMATAPGIRRAGDWPTGRIKIFALRWKRFRPKSGRV